MWVENQTEKSKKHQFDYKVVFLTETFVDTLKLYFEKLEKLENPYNFLISIEVNVLIKYPWSKIGYRFD